MFSDYQVDDEAVRSASDLRNLLSLQVQPPQPPWMAAFQQQQQQQQQQLAPPPHAQLPSPADAIGASVPAWWQQLAQQAQQPQLQQVTRQPV